MRKYGIHLFNFYALESISKNFKSKKTDEKGQGGKFFGMYG